MLVLEIAGGILLAVAAPVVALMVFSGFSVLLESISNVIFYRQNQRDIAALGCKTEGHRFEDAANQAPADENAGSELFREFVPFGVTPDAASRPSGLRGLRR